MPWSVAQGELTVQAQRLRECRRMRPRAAGRNGGRPRRGLGFRAAHLAGEQHEQQVRGAREPAAHAACSRFAVLLCPHVDAVSLLLNPAAQPVSQPLAAKVRAGIHRLWRPSATPGQVKKRNCCMQAAAHLSRAGFRRVTPSQVKEINW